MILPQEVMTTKVIFGQRNVIGGRRGGWSGEELWEDMMADLLHSDVIEAGSSRDCIRGSA